MRLLYLHGFASGPASTKARWFHDRFAAAGLQLEVLDLTPDFAHSTVSGQLAIVESALDRGPAGARAGELVHGPGGQPAVGPASAVPAGEGVVLMGSSLGGWLAALAAERRPGEVRGLLLLAPAFGFARRFADRLGPATVSEWRARGSHPVFHHRSGREEPLGIEFLDDALAQPPWPDPLCPAWIHAGRNDEAVPLAAIETFARRRPDRRWLRIHESGHELLDVLEPIWADVREHLLSPGVA